MGKINAVEFNEDASVIASGMLKASLLKRYLTYDCAAQDHMTRL